VYDDITDDMSDDVTRRTQYKLYGGGFRDVIRQVIRNYLMVVVAVVPPAAFAAAAAAAGVDKSRIFEMM